MAGMWYVTQVLLSDFWKMPFIQDKYEQETFAEDSGVRAAWRKLHCVIPTSALSPSVSPHQEPPTSDNLTPGHISGENSNLGKKNTLTPVFIAALFTIGKTWKQLKCPSTDDWFKKILYIYMYITCTFHYNGILLNHIKEWNLAFAATWMGLEIVILTAISQQRKANIVWYHLYVESKKKMIQMNLYPNRNKLTDIENKPKRKGEGVN